MSLAKSKSQFFFQLGTMYEAGVPLLNALATLQKQRLGWRLKRTVKRVKNRIQGGEGLADSFRAEGRLFNEFEVELIAAGEETGHLDVALHSLAEWLELVSRSGRRFLAGLVYPALLLHAGVVISGAIPYISGQIGKEAFLRQIFSTLVPFYVLFLALAYILPRLRRNVPVVAYLLDAFLMMIPIVRGVRIKLALARFALAFKGMLVSGVPVVYGLERASRACGNKVLGARIRRAIPRLKKGTGIADSLSRTRVFPAMAIEFIRTGEQSGSMDKMLGKMADLFSRDAEFAVDQAAHWLPWLFYLGVAIYVGYLVVSYYAGVYAGYEDLLSDLPM